MKNFQRSIIMSVFFFASDRALLAMLSPIASTYLTLPNNFSTFARLQESHKGHDGYAHYDYDRTTNEDSFC